MHSHVYAFVWKHAFDDGCEHACSICLDVITCLIDLTMPMLLP